MTGLAWIWREFVGLFVDDERMAVAVVAWLGVAGILLPRLSLPHGLAPVLLFGGLVAILGWSALRRAGGPP